MKKMSTIMLFGSSLLFLNTALSSKIPNTDQPDTFLGPTIRGGFSNLITDATAYSAALEFGLRNYRVGGTIGWKIAEDKRLKVSAEYLRQNITYAFFDGNTDQWVDQSAIGLAYEYDITAVLLNPQLNLHAYASYAPSKNIGTGMGTFVNSNGIVQSFTNIKRIAGSKAGGISPGISIAPWSGGRVGVELNYDDIIYRKSFGRNQDTVGLGGTIHLNQFITENVQVQLTAAARQPFNNYQANLVWDNLSYFGNWTLGFNTEFTKGKAELPDTYNVGISANYFLDQSGVTLSMHPDGIDRFIFAKDGLMPSGSTSLSQQAEKLDFLSWIAEPAVHMPQVLAIADERVNTVCADSMPIQISTIPNDTLSSDSFSVTPFFSGNNISYSIASITPTLSDGDTITLTSSGTISYSIITAITPYQVIIAAKNSCGSTNSLGFFLGP